ncbi:helicase C-terminal domain-containing protein [Sulfobacillus thermosulfidooxidans]|nr:helicase C-terminal domain-containing protein [Sulfobacillus thermosulfidooxidans]
MLYSKLIEGYGPALYVCPDNQLVDQVIEQARNYGIPACVFDGSGGYPSEFLNKQSVLVCNFDKLFNGKSIFVRDNIQLGAVLLDDAHTGVRRVRQNATITIPRSHALFQRLLLLFQKDLENQGAGTFARIFDNDPSPRALMRVPYWAWVSNHDLVVRMINEYRTDDAIDFAWQLLADDLLQCDCFISSQGLEISPMHVPYHLNPPFHEAKHRFVLSATFEDNSDLLRDLGISSDSALNALVPKDRKDIGERLILAPSRFDLSLDDEAVRKLLADYTHSHLVNTVVLVPSHFQADKWRNLGATIVDRNNISDALVTLKQVKGNLMVFVNRYDGVDLPGDMCRILVLDGQPSDHSLRDRYLNSVLTDSSAVNAKLAQTIEQGLGRAVRSGSDYSVVFLLGAELVRFLSVQSNYQYFAPVTAAQLSLGLQLLDGEDRSNPSDTIVNIVGYCLARDVNWRQYHHNIITSVSQNVSTHRTLSLDTARAEAEAIRLYRQRNYQAASQRILTLIEERKSELSQRELGWYFQLAAQLLFPGNRVRSNDLQAKAAQTTTGLFHPLWDRSITGLLLQAVKVP